MADTACIDFGGSRIKAALMHHGQALDSCTIDSTGPDTLTKLETLLRDWSHCGRNPQRVSIAVPGVVDPAGTRMLSAHGKYQWLTTANLPAWASNVLDIPTSHVTVHNDARAALAGETSTHGIAPHTPNAAILVLGTGLGTAAQINGHPLMGTSGHGGILMGHTTIDITGPLCVCGNRGCVEALASTWALTGQAALTPGYDTSPLRHVPRLDFQQLLQAVDQHDPCAVALLNHCLDVWAALLVTMCHTLDPQVLILTGGPMNAAPVLLEPLRQRVTKHLWTSMPCPALLASKNPTWSVAIGLATLADPHQETSHP